MIEGLHGETEGLEKETRIPLSISNLEAAWNPVYRGSSAGIPLKLVKQVFWSLSSQKERKLPKILSSSWALCWLCLCPFNWLLWIYSLPVLFCFVFSFAQHLREVQSFLWERFLRSPKNLKLFQRNTSRNCGTRFSLEVSVSLTYGWVFHFSLACLTDCR